MVALDGGQYSPPDADASRRCRKPEGETLPAGVVQGRNDFGYSGFGGACPPKGDKPHRYQFTVWALDVDKLPVDRNASGALVGFMLNSHVLAKASLTVTYSR